MIRSPRALVLPAFPVAFVALVALSNITRGSLGPILTESIIVTGFVTAVICVYLWIDRLALRRQNERLTEEKRNLEEVVARKASLETDLEVTSAVRELALVTGNTNDLDQALGLSARMTHDLVFDAAGLRAGIEVAIFLADPKGGRPMLRCWAKSGVTATGRKARQSDLASPIPEGALAEAVGGIKRPPIVRGGRAGFLVPLESAGGALGALYVGMPSSPEDDEELLRHVDQLLVRFAQHIAHATAKFALYDEATLDALTGLLTKRQYLKRLEQEAEAARSCDRTFSLIVIDLDHFKAVNDTHGHATGDMVLKRTAAILRRTIRPDDLAFRFGGEEMVVLTALDLHGATLLAERIRTAIREVLMRAPSGDDLRICASLGVAQLESGSDTAQALFERADKAVYESKDSGRDRTSVHTGDAILPAGKLLAKRPRRATRTSR